MALIRCLDANAADAVRDAMNTAVTESYVEKPRWRLGISEIGQPCARQTWYAFRWFTKRKYTAHQLRIFAFGNLIEPMLIDMFNAIGIKIATRDPSTHQQFRYEAVHGHFGGSCDGIIEASSLSPHRMIVECKSYNTGQFSAVVRDGIKVAKPQYHAQMCGYGYAFDAPYALHLGFNKNDSDITAQIIEIDCALAKENEHKAEAIILARVPPPKIATKATDYRCKMCDHIAVCHYGATPIKTCRSCTHAYPIDGGEWMCGYYSRIIPKETVYSGCNQYSSLT